MNYNSDNYLLYVFKNVLSAKPGKFILTEFYGRGQEESFKIPHVISFLNSELHLSEKSGTRYSEGCTDKIDQCIKQVKKAHKAGNKFFLYKTIKEDDTIKPESIDVFIPVETPNEETRYKMDYNGDHTGVVLKPNHKIHTYRLKSLLTDELLDVDDFPMDRTVSIDKVILKNVFNFISYDYYFASEDVEQVNEIIKDFKLSICEKCGKSFYIPPSKLKFYKDNDYSLPCICPACEKSEKVTN